MNIPPKMTKAQIGALEERLFSGDWSFEDIDVLCLLYQQQKNLAQWGRITDIKNYASKHIYVKQEKIFLQKDVSFSHKPGVYIFPFTKKNIFFSPSEQHNIQLLCYLLKESIYDELIIDNKICEEHLDVTSFLKDLCNLYNKKYRIVDKKTTDLISTEYDTMFVQKMLMLPSEIAILPLTGSCNVKCRFCEQAYTKIPYHKMDFDIFRHAINAIPDNMFIKVGLTPFQEPLSTKIFNSYLEYALKIRPEANITFNTNGTFLTEEVSRWLVDIGLKTIVISLNMPDPISYQNFIGKDFFNKVVNNIETLCRIKKQKNSSYPTIIVQYLKLPPVLGQEAVLQKRWENIADIVWFRNVSAPTSDPQKLALFKKFNPQLPETTLPREEALPCMSTMVTCAIDMFGYYLPCCTTLIERCNAGKRKFKFLEFGHVSNMDVQTAWNSQKLQQIRAWQLAGLIGTCNRCTSNQSNLAQLYALKNGIIQNCYLRNIKNFKNYKPNSIIPLR